jgi:hypothetical protein
MPRSAAQSDFVVHRPPPPATDGAPEEAGEQEPLPRAELRSHEASAGATRWVMTLTFVVLAALVILCVVGPHIPAGE